ncbi:imidazole glycerol phosphate synthase cyclase subunit [Roseivirga seohaensis]|uniref:imidazole glycerol-phosphate synthase n=1 Tax=Roseivirga seohaensis TaxID=1914963 RepID=A0A150XZD1_9BACT|nr:AglZ/HisF2 family acetamidino modification protein [Roseivirga seohaensis]KYG84012.1 imidazole glycerol phosphate synthase cyclase subunit [Roseivirga seohaensis]
MLNTRVIPTLLIKGDGLYKSVNFKSYRYVGDPINAIKIFNEKEVDEIVILDVEASTLNKKPNLKLIEKMATQAFMPVGYGGGITTLKQAKEVLSLGVEKIIVNSVIKNNRNLISEIASEIGSQSIVASIDVKKNFWGKYECYTFSGTKGLKQDPVSLAKELEKLSVGEIIIHSIDRDGTFKGYDTTLIKLISEVVNVPVVACGGAGSIEDFASAIKNGGASAVAAGSIFVFHGIHKAVLITYPQISDLEKLFQK